VFKINCHLLHVRPRCCQVAMHRMHLCGRARRARGQAGATFARRRSVVQQARKLLHVQSCRRRVSPSLTACLTARASPTRTTAQLCGSLPDDLKHALTRTDVLIFNLKQYTETPLGPSGGQGVASSNLASPTKRSIPSDPGRTCIQPAFLPPSMTPSGGRCTIHNPPPEGVRRIGASTSNPRRNQMDPF
jgi:hypothetical protein